MTTHMKPTRTSRQSSFQASGAASAPRCACRKTGELTPPRSPMDFASRLCFVTLSAFISIATPLASCKAASPDTLSESSSRVIITLRDSARSTSSVVRVVDVAELRNGTEALRKQIASLDLEDAPTNGKPVEVTARQIEFRLRIAGIDPRLVSIRGSAVQVTASHRTTASRSKSSADDATIEAKLLLASYAQLRSRDGESMDRLLSDDVSTNNSFANNSSAGVSDQSDIEQIVISAAQKCLTKQLPWPEENVVIQLAQPLPRELSERVLSDTAICTAELRSPGTPLGRVTVRVVLKEAGKRTVDVPVQLDVRHYENVVVTKMAFDRGHSFSSADFAIGWRDVTNLSGYCTSPDQLVGQKMKRLFPESQIVRLVDVETPTRSTALMPVLVKRRDRVTAIARSGALSVTSTWEAQQDGRAGEVIKFKNLHSSKEVYGRVISATEVEATD